MGSAAVLLRAMLDKPRAFPFEEHLGSISPGLRGRLVSVWIATGQQHPAVLKPGLAHEMAGIAHLALRHKEFPLPGLTSTSLLPPAISNLPDSSRTALSGSLKRLPFSEPVRVNFPVAGHRFRRC